MISTCSTSQRRVACLAQRKVASIQWAMTGGDRYAGLPPYTLGSGVGAVVVGMLRPTPVLLAQIAVSANDNKVMFVNGVATVVQNSARTPWPSLISNSFHPESLLRLRCQPALSIRRSALLSRRTRIWLGARIDDTKVEHTRRDLRVGLRQPLRL
jgi:hypothetical protein